ncbi:type VI secretion system lipoprotein TssJ, partial [Pseudomonas sp. SIMBA_059]
NDADPTLTDKVQGAVIEKASDAAGQSASNAMDSTFNSLVDSVK